MKKAVFLAIMMLTLAGCAKMGRGWVMDNSPYLDMLYEGKLLEFIGLAGGFIAWYFLREGSSLEGTSKPLMVGAAIFLVFFSAGVYKGWRYIHTSCTLYETQEKTCPGYKVNSQWPMQEPSTE